MTRKMKDSGIEWIGDIPEDWGRAKLKYYYDIKSGENLSNDFFQKDGIFDVIGSNSVIGKTNRFNNISEVITTGRVGTIGTCKIVNKCWITDNVLILKNKRLFDTKYMYYVVPNFDFKFISSGTAQPLITGTNLKNQYIPVSTVEEQKAIADFLDQKVSEIDNIISKTKEVIEEYKKYKQSLITEIVTKGLDENAPMKDSGIEWIGEIPKHWEVVRLRFLGRLQNGINKSGEEFGFGYPFINYGDIYNNYILDNSKFSGLVNSNKNERKKYSVKKGDVLFTRTSETIEEIGFASTCIETIKDSVFTGFAIRFRPFKNIQLYYGYSKYYFRSEMHRKYFVKEMNLVTRASLGQELLMKLPVIIPQLPEQKAIASYLDEKCSQIDNIIHSKEQLLIEIEKYKKSLIYETVTGKKEVK